MAKTNTEKIEDLIRQVSTHEIRLQNLEKGLEKLEQKLEKGLDKLESRLWWFVVAVITAIFGLLVTNLFKK